MKRTEEAICHTLLSQSPLYYSGELLGELLAVDTSIPICSSLFPSDANGLLFASLTRTESAVQLRPQSQRSKNNHHLPLS